MSVETPNESPKQRVLIPRPDGRGALMTGGTNNGGPGRPPAWIANRAREIFADAVESNESELAKIAKGTATRVINGQTQTPSFEAQLKAIDTAGKYGLGEAKQTTPDEYRQWAAEVFAEFYHLGELSQELAVRLGNAIDAKFMAK